jgi:hypothetical protein
MVDSASSPRRAPTGVVAGLRAWGRSIQPDRRHFGKDALAGLPGAISGVPDGMASAVLVGVNPVHGLYASFAGPVAGGLTASTRLMVITTTTAAALAAGSAVSGLDADQRPEALFLLTLLAGLVMLGAGLLSASSCSASTGPTRSDRSTSGGWAFLSLWPWWSTRWPS